jgi:hypothetical protein
MSTSMLTAIIDAIYRDFVRKSVSGMTRLGRRR